ncbi:MAG: helical backbone metal receptor [Gemmatimonadetes bacterium]|nr:helical backbone metal receptor [Gemmatimonadota bacterium]
MHRARAGRVTTPSRPWATVALFLSCACTGTSAGDAPGRAPPDPSAPRRIVSLIPQVSGIVRALGEADRLVSRIESDESPESAGLPSVGDPTRPSIERILGLDPDLLVLWDGSPANDRIIAALGDTEVWRTRSERLDDLWRNLAVAGALLSAPRRADSIEAKIRDDLGGVPASRRASTPPRVALIVWNDPPIAAGSGSFLDDLLSIAGGVNALGDVPGAWPRISIETLVHRDPEVVLWFPQLDEQPDLDADPRWRIIPALARGHAVTLRGSHFERPGLDVAEAARELAQVLQAHAQSLSTEER